MSPEFKKMSVCSPQIFSGLSVSELIATILFIYRQHYFLYLYNLLCSVKCTWKTDPPNDHLLRCSPFESDTKLHRSLILTLWNAEKGSIANYVEKTLS